MPATSKAQMRFMGAVAGGAVKKKGLPPSKAKEFVKGQHAKDLPERHVSKHNENTPLTVQGHRAEGESICVELGEGDSGSMMASPSEPGKTPKPKSHASLVMSKDEAAAYPVGSKVVLHCVPAEEEAEAEETEEKPDEGDGWDSFPPFNKED